ncbi:phosphotransferase [Rhizobium sp. BR 362]|uniref:phosphotransferase n=1 Tax=Rhizobium sp. BR 362 TaxID=3040670 RepID=UPI002F40F161
MTCRHAHALQNSPALSIAIGSATSGKRSRWTHPAIWVHGDIASGNLLIRGGRLHAVTDFGNSAVGDPACDLVINWTMFDASARRQFRAHYSTDADT